MLPPAYERPTRILFVFDWLVIGGEETEVRLLARNLDRHRYEPHVLACFRTQRMTPLTANQLRAMGVPLDTECYDLDDEGRAQYIAGLIRRGGFDIVVACQGVRHAYRALQLLAPSERPALIEHGGLVSEVFRTPKDLTTAYVGVCRDIVAAAAGNMPDPWQARLIPSMVDLTEFDSLTVREREAARAELGFRPEHRVAGWVGRLDRKKRVEDFVETAALLHRRLPQARFLVVGGPDAFMPEYAQDVASLARARGLIRAAPRETSGSGGMESGEAGEEDVLVFAGDRTDVPRLLYAMDALAWLSQGEGMPHVVLEAGAARLPVVATCDGGTPDVIVDGESGLFVPHQEPPAVAHALARVLTEPGFAATLGARLRATVERRYSSRVVCRQWAELFEELASPWRNVPVEVAYTANTQS